LEKNDWFALFAIILKSSKMLNAERSWIDGLPEDLTGNDLKFYKHALIISTGIERSFSRCKTILADNLRSLDVENI